MKFTDDPYVKETLSFLMTREVAHYKMFEAALDSIQPNFPPGVLQSDPRFTQQYFNMSNGSTVRGPWNEGEMPDMGKNWKYIEDPVIHIKETEGLSALQDDMEKEMTDTEQINMEMSEMRSEEVKLSEPEGVAQWSTYSDSADFRS
jgi:Mn-containing catalase